MVRVCVLAGNGINCENETAMAFTEANATSTIVHINQLITKEVNLADFDILALPGGFSYGDEIQSGKILALKLKKYLMQELRDFIHQNKLIIGICNGFQMLVHLDLFDQAETALMENETEKFINTWVDLKVNTNSFWTKDFTSIIPMPIRHGEGRFYSKTDFPKEQVLFTYTQNINGSQDAIAGITNKKGNVLGMMPHPEAALNPNLNPYKGITHTLFKNAVNMIKERQNATN